MASEKPSPRGKPKGNKRERTRVALLEAARTVIREKGYERTTLDEVARRAGMTTAHVITVAAGDPEGQAARRAAGTLLGLGIPVGSRQVVRCQDGETRLPTESSPEEIVSLVGQLHPSNALPKHHEQHETHRRCKDLFLQCTPLDKPQCARRYTTVRYLPYWLARGV